jgi:hypothetical protein
MASLKKRGPVDYNQFYVGDKQPRISTETGSFQIAKEKLRRFESAEARGEGSPLPSKTPITNVLTAYVAHIGVSKTAKSAQTDIYYLRDAFGPICDAVKVTSRNLSTKAKKKTAQARPGSSKQSDGRRSPLLRANHHGPGRSVHQSDRWPAADWRPKPPTGTVKSSRAFSTGR